MSKSYSGSCEFEFKIERYIQKNSNENNISKKYFIENELEPDIDYDIEIISLNISGNGYYYPGVYHAEPENCYPDESDLEIDSVTDSDGNDWYYLLTATEIDSITSIISENISSNDCDQYERDEDYYNDYYDDY